MKKTRIKSIDELTSNRKEKRKFPFRFHKKAKQNKEDNVLIKFIGINGEMLNDDEGEEEQIKINSFGYPSRFIKCFHFPLAIGTGQEFVNDKYPIIELVRTQSIFREIFSKPFLCYTKKIGITFHWDGIEVVGSKMVAPNSFVFLVPPKIGDKYGKKWFLKIICKKDATPGIKPFYFSIDTYHENIFLKGVYYLVQFISILAIIGIPILFIFKDNAYVQNIISNDLLKGTNEISKAITNDRVFLLIPVLVFAFWKNINDVFKSFYEHEGPDLYVNSSFDGSKAQSNHGIKVFESKN
jgi:hypothetical protein